MMTKVQAMQTPNYLQQLSNLIMMVKLKVKIVHNLYQYHKQGFKVLLLQYDDDLAMFSH